MPTLICPTCGLTPERVHTLCRKRKDGSTRTYTDLRCRRCEAIRQRKSRATGHGQFIQAKSIAKRRGIPWELTEPEYLGLRLLPCDYCDFPLPPTGMAIDRVDTTGTYCVYNVVPCCAECNIAKNASFTYSEMKLLGQTIAFIKQRRQDRGETNHVFGRPRKHLD